MINLRNMSLIKNNRSLKFIHLEGLTPSLAKVKQCHEYFEDGKFTGVTTSNKFIGYVYRSDNKYTFYDYNGNFCGSIFNLIYKKKHNFINQTSADKVFKIFVESLYKHRYGGVDWELVFGVLKKKVWYRDILTEDEKREEEETTRQDVMICYFNFLEVLVAPAGKNLLVEKGDWFERRIEQVRLMKEAELNELVKYR